MDVEIIKRPSNAAAKVTFSPGEGFTAEGGAMIAMSGSVTIETTVNKPGGRQGIMGGFARMLAGEGFFLNHYTVSGSEGQVFLATHLPGDMQLIELDGSRKVKVQHGSFVAHESSVEMNIRWDGLKNMFSGEKMIWLEFSGAGKLIINAFGAVYPVDVDGEYIVDTGNIAAFEDTLDFTISKAGKSWVSSFLGGEGLVCRFRGKGRVWCQSHADGIFGHALTPHLTPKKQ